MPQLVERKHREKLIRVELSHGWNLSRQGSYFYIISSLTFLRDFITIFGGRGSLLVFSLPKAAFLDGTYVSATPVLNGSARLLPADATSECFTHWARAMPANPEMDPLYGVRVMKRPGTLTGWLFKNNLLKTAATKIGDVRLNDSFSVWDRSSSRRRGRPGSRDADAAFNRFHSAVISKDTAYKWTRTSSSFHDRLQHLFTLNSQFTDVNLTQWNTTLQ